MASGEIDVTPGRVLAPTEVIDTGKLNDLGRPILRVKEAAITSRELAPGSIDADKLSVTLEAQLGVADGSITTNKIVDGAVTVSKLAWGIAIPVGCIVDFGGTTAPAGWLLCGGGSVSRTDFAALFAVIGTLWGAGDGTTTFGLPDLRGFVTAHVDGGTNRLGTVPVVTGGISTVGSYIGYPHHTLTEAQMPWHYHNFTDYYAVLQMGVQQVRTPTSGGLYFGVTTTTVANNTAGAGGGSYHNNTQFTAIVNKIIRYL